MGHGHGEHFRAPDWKSYKINGIPELEQLKRLLAAQGLKDPWIRNEVWRYDPKFYGNEYRNALKSLGRGLKYAVGAMVITIAVESFMKKKKNGTAHESDSENGHH